MFAVSGVSTSCNRGDCTPITLPLGRGSFREEFNNGFGNPTCIWIDEPYVYRDRQIDR